MEERRRDKRSNLETKNVLKRLDDSTNTEYDIEIIDLSKSGIGFECKEALNIGTVYESFLTIWTKEVIHAFIQVVRIEMKEDEDTYLYGASFVGMPELEASRIDIYQKFN